MDLWERLANKQSDREKKQRDKWLSKVADRNFKYRWNQCKDIDGPERDALMNYVTAKRRIEERIKREGKLSARSEGSIIVEMKIEQASLLWEKGYRHGDHVLVYEPFDGSLNELVVLRYSGNIQLLPPKMASDFESVPSRSAEVESEDRTKRKSQPDLASHESGWVLPNRLSR